MTDLVRPDGCHLYYETHGNANAPPLVLLEGMGGDIPGWRRNIPRLAKELFVVAYAGRIPGAELARLEGAGHLHHSERAEEADAVVVDFVRRHDDG